MEHVFSAGTHVVTAAYSGDVNYTAASGSVTQQVTATSVDGILENFYLTILGRASDPGGKLFYLSEVERLFGLAVDRRESLRVIAKSFYFSAE